MPKTNVVTFTYKNWKGNISERKVIPEKIYFGSTEFHKEEQWLLSAYDCDKADYRDFAMQDISNWKAE